MAFKQKRDFGHYSEIRQGILKKIKNVYDDDFNENIVKIFISHSSKNKHDAKNIKNILRDFFPCIEVFVAHDDLQPTQNFNECNRCLRNLHRIDVGKSNCSIIIFNKSPSNSGFLIPCFVE